MNDPRCLLRPSTRIRTKKRETVAVAVGKGTNSFFSCSSGIDQRLGRDRGGRKNQGPAEFFSSIVFLGLMQATLLSVSITEMGDRKAMKTCLSRDDFDR